MAGVRLSRDAAFWAGMEPSRPAWKSSNAWASSALVFITNGP